MAAKDIIHEAVKKALENDGWVITDDPLIVIVKEDNVAIDLGAEKFLLASKNSLKIAVEVKSFTRPSVFYSFHEALGQYINYETALSEAGEDRQLFLAVTNIVFDLLMNNYIIKKSIEKCKLRIIVVDYKNKKIERWIK